MSERQEFRPLPAAALCRRCDAATLGFASTAEVADGDACVGQARATEALRFGIGMRQPGYNLFVLGNAGSGRHPLVRRLLEEQAAGEPVPVDWCYVNNFKSPSTPRLLQLPAGRGSQLRRDMQQFVSELPQAIAAGFETDEYRTRIEAIRDELKEREATALNEIGHAAREQGVALLRTPNGFVFAPIKGDEAMAPDEFEQLPDEEKARIGKRIAEFGERLSRLMRQLPRWRRGMQERLREASRATMWLAVGHLIEELKERYGDLPAVLAFLDEVMADVVEVGEELREHPKADGEPGELALGGSISVARYQVNLLVDRGEGRGAPVVVEDNPIFPNLVGRVDHVAHMGMLVTDFTFIRAGALQRANGGYLVLDALRVLAQPYAWEGLKRALRSAQVRIESLAQVYGFGSTLPIDPEPMPLSVKVVLIGERRLYYLLKQFDPEFDDLFKIAADFENELPRDDDGVRGYARFVAALARAGGLRPFAAAAVARVVEHGARLAGDADKLSTDRRRLAGLLAEADHLAGVAGHATVERGDVEAALAGQVARADRLRGTLYEQIARGTLLIAVDGVHPAQVNGLAVIDLGDFRFAHPVRITATARIGDGGVVDIEREAELGGAIHSKGVMILAAFLGARYAAEQPLSLSASLVFEQSYGPVEGDSASLAELCALLSALSGVPLRQSLAVTGSVNQHGRVQAVGGVNEKIEGFFDVCRARGLSGAQAVLIPADNVKHLMLRDDVVAACAEGRFAIYAVAHVDQAVELLTGVAAGAPDAAGVFPDGSVNGRVAARLAQLSSLRKEFGGGGRKKAPRR
ncbi:Lon protease family protein [Azospira restricta]|uniref:endopeptidase La n=1 Tax=Azospira restricta TaxID=404405 RepID=A0A974SPB9_9RHOO|nr:ATP-binding protein [Azospira restricta]QRJ63970.1 AAA family ATPase [Azospira restricta]